MKKEDVFHRQHSEYAYGIDENRVVIRIRTGRDDILSCILHYGDR